ncbi:DUF885 domain-containing protein [Bacteroidota bacterium]
MKNLYFGLILLAVFSCNKHEKTDMKTLSDEFIQSWWHQFPTQASSAGFHNYDSLLPAYSSELRNSDRDFAAHWLERLQAIEPKDLANDAERSDLALMKEALNSLLFYTDTLKAWEWDPSMYNVAGAFADIVNAKNLDSIQKRNFITARMKAVPDYYTTAARNINKPTPEHLQLAIDQHAGVMDYLFSDIATWVNEPSLLESAEKAMKRYASFLTSISQKPDSNYRDFRLGKSLYASKFKHDIQAALSADEIYEKAVQRKAELHAEMFNLSKQLWPLYMKSPLPQDSLQLISEVIQELSKKHTKPENFLATIQQQIPELEKFVVEKDLLTLDPNKPLKVRKTPAYMDGVAGASISAPGPYDEKGETFYNVSTLETYSAEQAESYLREYNDYVLQILNIHEAIPGHYAQLVYANKSPSLIKSVFGNGAMIEGWAVYSERAMMDAGYGNGQPEMKLFYSKWHLRTVCNTILDYSIHCLNWNKDQALDLLVRQAFQQEAEAQGKWKRATLSQVQLCSYFAGYSEIMALKQELESKPGFNLKAFHEKLLSFGSAPVKEIAAMMKGENN